ncbi:MAG: SDR family oxidoreductase [Anaerolineae bacterium]|nr:SDR family oxidoreductase [Anaerolineae bacterium]
MSNLLAGQHVAITGAGRGIGAAIADAFVAHGARLSLMGRDGGRLQRKADQLNAQTDAAFGPVAQAIVVDITQAESVVNAFAKASATFGPVTILVNNAGNAESAPIHKTDFDLWQRMLTLNLTGTFLCTQQVVSAMSKAGWGRIVNVASTAGLLGYAYVSAYCAAKHGVIGFTRALALELAQKGVTVNAVCPGYTDTDLVAASVDNIVAKTGRSAEQAIAELVKGNPQKRLIKPEEVANAVAWLCLPGSESITGQAIAVAGGEVMN